MRNWEKFKSFGAIVTPDFLNEIVALCQATDIDPEYQYLQNLIREKALMFALTIGKETTEQSLEAVAERLGTSIEEIQDIQESWDERVLESIYTLDDPRAERKLQSFTDEEIRFFSMIPETALSGYVPGINNIISHRRFRVEKTRFLYNDQDVYEYVKITYVKKQNGFTKSGKIKYRLESKETTFKTTGFRVVVYQLQKMFEPETFEEKEAAKKNPNDIQSYNNFPYQITRNEEVPVERIIASV